MTVRVAEATRQGFSFSRAAALVSRVSRSCVTLFTKSEEKETASSKSSKTIEISMLNVTKHTFLGQLVNGTFEKRAHAGLLNSEPLKKWTPVMF